MLAGADYGFAKAIEEGLMTGPRLLFCGHAISQTGGHGDMRLPGDYQTDHCFCCAGLGRVCDGVADVRRTCRDEIRKGAHQIKLMVSGGVASPTDRITSTQFSEDEIQAAVEEAEAANLYVMAHAYTNRAIMRALECGVRSIEHGNLIEQDGLALLKQKKGLPGTPPCQPMTGWREKVWKLACLKNCRRKFTGFWMRVWRHWRQPGRRR